jgi:Ni,Fe-hydrogenase III large subunit
MPMYTPPQPPVDNDDGISNDAIGGPTGHLLEHNAQVIGQIRANLAACKLQENTELLVQFRDNIYAILNGMTNMPGIMSQMPPLPVNLNSELADRILPMPQSSAPTLHQ